MTLRDWSDARGDTELSADVVIVGSGPGGAAVSRVLAEEGGLDVVMLEEGPARPRFRPNMAHTNRYHMQEGGAMVARSRDAMMPVAAGRGVGGGSLVNSAICFRTPEPVLDSWTEVLGGDDRFAAHRLRPIFAELEEILEIAETPEAIAGENNKLVVRGAKALGLPGGYVRRNTPRCQGCGICNFGCPVGGKASVDTNLIPTAREHGAVVQADTKVDRILVEGDRAVGVSGAVHHTDTGEQIGRITVRADKVFVCCGGIGTPRLLHHAGLADRLGPAVGQGLHIHPGSALLGLCDFPVKMWSGATQGAWFEDPDLPGVLPHTFNLPPSALLLLLGAVGHEAKEQLHTVDRYCGCLVMISDKGTGWVGARPDGRAAIGYDFTDHDLQRIKDGMYTTARVLFAGGAKQVLTPVHGVGVHDSPESLRDALVDRTIHDFTMYASHPMGSCRMGVDPATSVIGPTGEAHGLQGLYLADSSIFPTSLGVNPQLTTMTMATAIARNLLAAS